MSLAIFRANIGGQKGAVRWNSRSTLPPVTVILSMSLRSVMGLPSSGSMILAMAASMADRSTCDKDPQNRAPDYLSVWTQEPLKGCLR